MRIRRIKGAQERLHRHSNSAFFLIIFKRIVDDCFRLGTIVYFWHANLSTSVPGLNTRYQFQVKLYPIHCIPFRELLYVYGPVGLSYVYGHVGLPYVYGPVGLPYVYGPVGLPYVYGPVGLPYVYGHVGLLYVYVPVGLPYVHGPVGLPYVYCHVGLLYVYGPVGLPYVHGPVGLPYVYCPVGQHGSKIPWHQNLVKCCQHAMIT